MFKKPRFISVFICLLLLPLPIFSQSNFNADDPQFWNQSLYNVWLQAIRLLNPQTENSGHPFFMKTVAWQQEKMNTQLASWSQLRHDNLLYAKQSYTGATGCSFPHSYIEPYPEFYRQIASFADEAAAHLSDLSSQVMYLQGIKNYFPLLSSTMKKLEMLAQKELNRELFGEEDQDFLKRMLFQKGGSSTPPLRWLVCKFILRSV